MSTTEISIVAHERAYTRGWWAYEDGSQRSASLAEESSLQEAFLQGWDEHKARDDRERDILARRLADELNKKKAARAATQLADMARREFD